MKTAILLHGDGGNEKDYFWFIDTKKFLEDKGYQVWWPLLPNPESQNLIDTTKHIQDNAPVINDETIMIAHSSGCPSVLHILQFLNIQIKQAILVSGFYEPRHFKGPNDPMIPKPYFDFEVIREHAKEIIFINSNDDPWGCDDKQARPVAIKLGAKFMLAKGQGHMGSMTYNQPYKVFPLLKSLIE